MSDQVTVRIMRRQLYERVWAESVAHVAPQLGLWPTRLSKLCRKHRIPVPGRGFWYWARGDKKAMRDPLPDADLDWEITFTPSQPGPPKPVADASAVPGVVVPERLSRSHRLVQEARKHLEDAWAEHGMLHPPRGCLDIRVSPASLSRACRIMDTLIKECERRGWTVRATAPGCFGTVITVDGCDVGIRLVEAWRQEPRVLSESEKAREEQRERPRKRPPYNLTPNGRLTLQIEYSEARLYGQWRDGKRRRLEDMLDDAVARLAGTAERKRQVDKALAAAEERRREEERIRHEEEERQREPQRIRMAEQERVNKLLDDAESWEQSRRLRAYIEARLAKMKADGQDMTQESKSGKWATWARNQADRLDPLVKCPPSTLDTAPDPDPPTESKKSFAEIMNSLGEC